MKNSFEPDPPHFPICWECCQPIIPDDEYYRIGSGSRTHIFIMRTVSMTTLHFTISKTMRRCQRFLSRP